MPGDLPLLVELRRDHVPALTENVLPEPDCVDIIEREFFGGDRCNLDVFRELLELRDGRAMPKAVKHKDRVGLNSEENCTITRIRVKMRSSMGLRVVRGSYRVDRKESIVCCICFLK